MWSEVSALNCGSVGPKSPSVGARDMGDRSLIAYLGVITVGLRGFFSSHFERRTFFSFPSTRQKNLKVSESPIPLMA